MFKIYVEELILPCVADVFFTIEMGPIFLKLLPGPSKKTMNTYLRL